MQNNLSELFAMCDFVNPNCLGPFPTFRNTFANPIEKSRDEGCSKKVKAIGDARSKELGKICNSFILRRTADILR